MRTRSTTTQEPQRKHDWKMVRPSGVIATTRTYTDSGRVKAITDVEVPRFTSLKKCGEILPLNPVSISTDHLINNAIEGTITGIPGASWWWEGEIHPLGNIPWDDYLRKQGWMWQHIPDPDPQILAAVELAAIAKLKSKRWDVLTLLAEMDATVSTIVGLFKLFASRTHQLRELKEARRNPAKFFAGKWLEWRYGIRPILYDVQSALETFEALKGDLNLILTGKSGEIETSNTTLSTGLELSHSHYSTWWEREVTVKTSYRGFALARFDNAGARLVTTDLFVTAWELSKLSFVVDWFIDIGSYIGGLSSVLLGETEARCTSTKQTIAIGTASGFTAQGASRPASSIVTSRQGWAGISIEQYVRTPVSGVPSFSQFVGVSNMDLPKWADLLALVVQFASGGDPKRRSQRR